MVTIIFEDNITVEGNYSYIAKVLDLEIEAGQKNWAEFHKYITRKNDNLEPIIKVTIIENKKRRVIGVDCEITRCDFESIENRKVFIGQIIF